MQFGICNTCGHERETNEIYDKDCVEKGVQLGKIRKEVVRGVREGLGWVVVVYYLR